MKHQSHKKLNPHGSKRKYHKSTKTKSVIKCKEKKGKYKSFNLEY